MSADTYREGYQAGVADERAWLKAEVIRRIETIKIPQLNTIIEEIRALGGEAVASSGYLNKPRRSKDRAALDVAKAALRGIFERASGPACKEAIVALDRIDTLMEGEEAK